MTVTFANVTFEILDIDGESHIVATNPDTHEVIGSSPVVGYLWNVETLWAMARVAA